MRAGTQQAVPLTPAWMALLRSLNCHCSFSLHSLVPLSGRRVQGEHRKEACQPKGKVKPAASCRALFQRRGSVSVSLSNCFTGQHRERQSASLPHRSLGRLRAALCAATFEMHLCAWKGHKSRKSCSERHMGCGKPSCVPVGQGAWLGEEAVGRQSRGQSPHRLPFWGIFVGLFSVPPLPPGPHLSQASSLGT